MVSVRPKSHVLVCDEALLVDLNANCWIIDSGATKHVTWDRTKFKEFQSMDMGSYKLYKGNNSSEDVLGVGEYHLCTSKGKNLVLHETFNSLGMKQNLLSINRLVGDGFDIRFNKNRVSFRVNNVLFAWGSLVDNLFVFGLGCI